MITHISATIGSRHYLYSHFKNKELNNGKLSNSPKATEIAEGTIGI